MFSKGDIIKIKTDSVVKDPLSLAWSLIKTPIITETFLKGTLSECKYCYDSCNGCCYQINDGFTTYKSNDIDSNFILDQVEIRKRKLERILNNNL